MTDQTPKTPQPAERLDLSHAAAYVVALHADSLLASSARAALGVFALLVGLTDDDALTYAHTIAAGDVSAYLPPL